VADLNTNINIVIQNLKKVKDLGKTFKDAAKDAERIENKIKAINANLNRAKQKFNTVDPDMPRDKKGRFVKDADRNRRRNAYAELRMQKARQVTEKRSVQRDLDVILEIEPDADIQFERGPDELVGTGGKSGVRGKLLETSVAKVPITGEMKVVE